MAGRDLSAELFSTPAAPAEGRDLSADLFGAPKPAPNFARGPAGYKSSNFSVGPTATKPTAAAATAGKTPTAQQQQEYYDSLGLAEDLSWSKSFDPGRSLYRQMKKES
jgi:hypothetical protein